MATDVGLDTRNDTRMRGFGDLFLIPAAPTLWYAPFLDTASELLAGWSLQVRVLL
jgi:hypothetical protein